MEAGEQWSSVQRHLHSAEFISLVSASALLKQAAVPAWGERNRQQFWKAMKRAGGAAPRNFFLSETHCQITGNYAVLAKTHEGLL